MIKVELNKQSYDFLRYITAEYLANQMFDGSVQFWDEINLSAFNALIDLNKISA